MSIEPITRKEMFMAKASGQNVNTPKPITREEKFLERIAENGGKATSWKDLGETTVMGDTLTWDGNTEGLYSVADMFYLISDVIPTLEDLQNGGIVTQSDGTPYTFNSEQVLEMGSDTITISTEIVPIIVLKGGASFTVEDVTVVFEKAGIYSVHDGEYYIAALKINGYNGFPTTEIVPIPEEYLPSERLFIRQNSDGSWSADEKVFSLSTLEMFDVIVDDGSSYSKVDVVNYANENMYMIGTRNVNGLIIDKANKTIMQD